MNEEEIQEIITLIGCLDIDDIEPVNKYTANVLRKILNTYKDLQQRIDKAIEYINELYDNTDDITCYHIDKNIRKELLEILKGSDSNE